jgi:multicomponent Na+:H+ antiporter subunit G
VSAVLDVTGLVLLLAGCAFALFAGIGLLRFPDVLSRLHAGTKPQVTCLVLIFLGAALRLRGGSAVTMLLVAVVLQLMTAPISAHLVAKVAYRRRHVRTDLLLVHETGLRGLEDPDESTGDRPADEPPPPGRST